MWTVAGRTNGDTRTQFYRVNCKCWNCPYCGPRKAKRYKRAIRITAENHNLTRFITLTLDPSKISGDPVRYLRSIFNKFRTYLHRKYGQSITYIAILEFHQNGNPHLHLLVGRYVPQAWISESWDALGGGRIVDIRYVDVHRISRYLSKYLTKELLLSAPKRARRVTTSRNINLLEKPQRETKWVLLRACIFVIFGRLESVAIDVQVDEDGILQGFAVVSENA